MLSDCCRHRFNIIHRLTWNCDHPTLCSYTEVRCNLSRPSFLLLESANGIIYFFNT